MTCTLDCISGASNSVGLWQCRYRHEVLAIMADCARGKTMRLT
jgi:hypothetical protein